MEKAPVDDGNEERKKRREGGAFCIAMLMEESEFGVRGMSSPNHATPVAASKGLECFNHLGKGPSTRARAGCVAPVPKGTAVFHSTTASVSQWVPSSTPSRDFRGMNRKSRW